MLSRNSLPSDASAQAPSSATPAPATPSPAVHSSEQTSPPAAYPAPVIWPSPEPGDPLAEQSGDSLDCPPPDPDECPGPWFGESGTAAPGPDGQPFRPAWASGPIPHAPPPTGFGYVPPQAASDVALPSTGFGHVSPLAGPGYAPPASSGYVLPVPSGHDPLLSVPSYVPPAVDLDCVEGAGNSQGSADVSSGSGADASDRSGAVPHVAAGRRSGPGGRHRAAGRARHSVRVRSGAGRSPGGNNDEARQAARRVALFAGAACALYSTGLTLGLTAGPNASRPLVPLPAVPTATATDAEDMGEVDSGRDAVTPERMAAGSSVDGTPVSFPHGYSGSVSPPAFDLSGTAGGRRESSSPSAQGNRSGSMSPRGGPSATSPAPAPSDGISSARPTPTHAGPAPSPTSSGQAGPPSGQAPRGGGKPPTGHRPG